MDSNIATFHPFGLRYLYFMIYLNTAGTGKLTAKSVNVAKSYLEQMAENGSLAAVKWRSELDLPTRKAVAEIMGAEVHQVALLPNTSFGLTSIAQRLVGERKRVLTIEGDYPSITLPWNLLEYKCSTYSPKNGIVLADELIKSIEANSSEIVVLSHVMWHTGYKVDIDAICKYCRAHGIISVIDVTQSLGTIPLSFAKIDADVMLSSTYKWLHAGFGLGLMAMSNDFFEAYPPKIGGFASFQEVNGNWEYIDSMKSYQPGSLSISAMAILKSSIDEILAIGVETIHDLSIRRVTQLLEVLKKHPVKLLGKPNGASLSNIVCIESIPQLAQHLAEREVIVVERNNHIRLSVTHRTTESEIKAFDEVLRQFFTA